MSRRVVVTGLGAVAPCGLDVPSTWEGLLAGRSGVRTIEDDRFADLPVRFAGQVAVDPKELREQARNALREQKFEPAYAEWAAELRARAYVELRDPPQP